MILELEKDEVALIAEALQHYFDCEYFTKENKLFIRDLIRKFDNLEGD